MKLRQKSLALKQQAKILPRSTLRNMSVGGQQPCYPSLFGLPAQDTVLTIPYQSTACQPLSSHQHCFSYLLGKWCFLVPKNSFTEYFSRFLFSSTLSLYALNLRPKSPQKTLLLVQFFLLSWKEEKYVGEKFFLTYDRIMITTGICPKTFAPIYPHYKSFDSYIKPQRNFLAIRSPAVVYLLIPTSNHNLLVRCI